MHRNVAFLVRSFVLFSLFLFLVPLPAAAQCSSAVAVANTADSGAGSLRQAIADVCAGGTITFAAGLSGGTIPLSSQLVLNKNVAIDGSALASPVTISGQNAARVFYANTYVVVTLSHLRIANGHAADHGGGIYFGGISGGELTLAYSTLTGNSATLDGGGIFIGLAAVTVANSTLAGNTAGADGGGIYAIGGLTLTNSTLSGNSASRGAGFRNDMLADVTNSTLSGNIATVEGGGVYNTGILTVNDSTLAENEAWTGYSGTCSGGGVYNASTGKLTVTNSTLAQNQAWYQGGGIYNAGETVVTNSTFSNNAGWQRGGGIYNASAAKLTVTNSTLRNLTMVSGASIYNDHGTLHMANTIIADAIAGSYDCDSINGTMSTNVNNLVEDGGCWTGGVNFLTGDPQLADLANNGGPTWTMALLPGSPALDSGDDAICAAAPVGGRDQRGVSRPQEAHCDRGAYEVSPIPMVTAFGASTPSTINIPITAFSARDDVAVTGYLITTAPTQPAASDAGWTATPPGTYTAGSAGDYTLYPWAKDAAGNVSAVYGAPVAVHVCAPALAVTSAADSGAGSLREALANACSGGTITFGASLSGDVIPLASQLVLNQDVTIDGSALSTRVAVSGQNAVRIFYVSPGVTATLRSLEITNGNSHGATVNAGGGIFNDQGTLTVVNSALTRNSSAWGGAIYNRFTTLTVLTSTLEHNTAANEGGGIRSDYGTLTVANSTLAWNQATTNGGGISTIGGAPSVANSTLERNTAAWGAAIYNASATLTVRNSTLSYNTAASDGGGIRSDYGDLAVANSTLAWNQATGSGGALSVVGNVPTVTNSTVAWNSAAAGGGIHNDGGTLHLANTIVANSTGGGDCALAGGGTIGTNLNNLVMDGSCAAGGVNFKSGNPSLTVLSDHGGPTWTMALQPYSSAIDAGDDATCAAAPIGNKDQRGVTRPQLLHCDIGACEYADTTPPVVTSFDVTTPSTSRNIAITSLNAADDLGVTGYLITTSATQPAAGDPGWTATAPDSFPVGAAGDYTLYPWAKDAVGHVSAVYGSPVAVRVTCVPAATVIYDAHDGPGTLRRALVEVCAGGTITFAAGLSGSTMQLWSQLVLDQNVTIDGSALAAPITLDGRNSVRVMTVNPGVTATLNGLRIANGSLAWPHVGAGIANYGTLTVRNSTVAGNRSGDSGGGIANYGTLTIRNSTLSGNSAGWGGGIFNSQGTVTVANSTLAGNTTLYGNSAGGGINNWLGTLTLKNSTLSGSAAPTGGGIHNDGGTLHMANTIVANSTGGGDCLNDGGTIGTNLNNVIEDGSCAAGGVHLNSGDPRLGPLADHGGPTWTMALGADSPAIDAGDAATCAAAPISGTDQRGQARDDLRCDVGAYELRYADSDTVIRPAATSLTTFGPALAGIWRDAGYTDPGVITVTKEAWSEHGPRAIATVWDVTPTITSGFRLTLQLCYTGGELGSLSEAALLFWRYHEGVWDQVGGAPTLTTANGYHCAALSGVNELSRWTLATGAPTALELAWFTATTREGAVALAWETAGEVDLLGFYVYRAEAVDGPRTRLTGELLPSQAPGSPAGAVYAFVDEAAAPDVSYWYWLEAVDACGAATLHGPVPAAVPAGEGMRVYLPVVRR